MLKTVTRATGVAGTLDILAAIILTLYYGKRSVGDMLRGVASGPFPDAPQWGTGGAVLGLAVHFVLMAIMVWVFVLTARQRPQLTAKPIQWGIMYGLATFFVMNFMVVPLRFGAWPPKPINIATQLFCHIFLVGIPIALIAARDLRSGANE